MLELQICAPTPVDSPPLFLFYFYFNMAQSGAVVRQQQEQAKLLKCHGGLNSFGVLENDIL